MNKTIRNFLIGISLFLLPVSVALFFNLLDQPASSLAALILPYPANLTWPYRFRQIGAIIFVLSTVTLLTIFYLSKKACFDTLIKVKVQAFNYWLDQKIGQLPNANSRLPNSDSWPKLKIQDWLIVGIFLAYAILLFNASIQGNYPNLLLGGDSANTASFAAGLDHPELFASDMLLNSPGNLRIYSTFNVFFMRLIYPIIKNYALSLAILGPVQVFLQLVGFYLFGLILFSSRFWGVALTTLLSTNVHMNLGEYWGISVDPIARFNFQAVLPFILCMVLVWRNKTARWPWIMAASGLLVYLHPVSTPCWAVAIWFSLFLFVPRRWHILKRLGYMISLGFLFLFVTFPYIITYLTYHVQGKSTNYELVYNVIVNYFPENLLNIPAAMETFLKIMLQNGLLLFAVISLIVVLILRRSHREPLNLILSWIFSIFLMSVVVPFFMHTYEHIFRLIPAETEMARSIRYLIPIMLLLGLWMVYEISLRIPFKSLGKPFSTIGLIVVLIGGIILTAPNITIQSAISCLIQGQMSCNHLSDYDLLIQAVETYVPERSPIFATFANNSQLSYGLPFRYIALRPLTYSFKDRGQLVYSNEKALQKWNDVYQQTLKIEQMPGDTFEKLDQYLILARQLEAHFLVSDFQVDLSKNFNIDAKEIYRNNRFTLMEINLK